MNKNIKIILSKKIFLHALFFLVALVSSAVATSTVTHAGKIAFLSVVSKHYDIFVGDSDGSKVTNITNTRVDEGGGRRDLDIQWSPDGSKILYSVPGLLGGIYTRDADGSNPVKLASIPLIRRRFLRWSPDGSKVAIADSSLISVVNSDTRNLMTLTDFAQGGGRSPNFQWSPDGSKIVFTSTTDGNSEIYVVNSDGLTAPQNVTNTLTMQEGGGRWSPDGSQLSFIVSNNNGGGPIEDNGVYVVKSDGTTTPVRLATEGFYPFPEWSPNGNKIAFVGRNGLFVMNKDGLSKINVSDSIHPRKPFQWSPDGSKIFFPQTGRSSVLYVANSDGTKLVAIPNANRETEWSPDSSQLVFSEVHDIFVVDSDGTKRTNVSNIGNARVPQWQPITSHPFSSLGIEKMRVKKDEFELECNFILDGRFNPMTERVSVTVGLENNPIIEEELIAGSFFPEMDGGEKAYHYNGPEGRIIRMVITENGRCKIKAKGVDASSIVPESSVVLSLEFGTHVGTTTINLDEKMEFKP